MKSLRKQLVIGWLVFLPSLLLASAPTGMMLYFSDFAIVNGAKTSTNAMAIFANDTVQTEKNNAKIGFTGATVALDQNTLVTTGTDSVRLDHGVLLVVDTATSVAVHAGDVFIVPADVSPTQFEIRDENHKLQIVAKKGDLLIKDCNGSKTLAEGKMRTRDDSAKCKKGAPPGAEGPLLTSKDAEIAGGLAGAGLLIWLAQGGGSNPPPVSPVQP
ncbi:MAG TPA: hypothetical protein VGG46_07030 [Terriglobales bacterium]|jgi:hypothetical protein